MTINTDKAWPPKGRIWIKITFIERESIIAQSCLVIACKQRKWSVVPSEASLAAHNALVHFWATFFLTIPTAINIGLNHCIETRCTAHWNQPNGSQERIDEKRTIQYTDVHEDDPTRGMHYSDRSTHHCHRHPSGRPKTQITIQKQQKRLPIRENHEPTHFVCVTEGPTERLSQKAKKERYFWQWP